MDCALLTGRTLLDGVCKLMRDQFLALRRLWLEFILAEIDVVAIGKRVRSQLRALMGGIGAGMNADVFKILAEARLHEIADGRRQRRST